MGMASMSTCAAFAITGDEICCINVQHNVTAGMLDGRGGRHELTPRHRVNLPTQGAEATPGDGARIVGHGDPTPHHPAKAGVRAVLTSRCTRVARIRAGAAFSP
jgi:hypothetical protein